MGFKSITVETVIKASIDKVWTYWTEPEHITHWNFASADWHAPRAENDLRPGGRFSYRMEAVDGSAGFDFSGTYTEIKTTEIIEFLLDDDRIVRIHFSEKEGKTSISETFEAESDNSLELQQFGWQAILDCFKAYVEAD